MPAAAIRPTLCRVRSLSLSCSSYSLVAPAQPGHRCLCLEILADPIRPLHKSLAQSRFGIVLSANAEGLYLVEDTIAGYAGAASGMIRQGDVFVAIDHISVPTPLTCVHAPQPPPPAPALLSGKGCLCHFMQGFVQEEKKGGLKESTQWRMLCMTSFDANLSCRTNLWRL